MPKTPGKKTRRQAGGFFDPGRAVAVCVGVEDYAHLPQVVGATDNTSRLFDLVTKSETAICQSEKSRLLLNPTYGEFHRFLESYTYQLSEGDHLFVYFCGRTEFVNGKSILCLRDSSYLPSGVINPFTVQGWQAFFQLAGVVRSASMLFVWDARGNSGNESEGRSFLRSLRSAKDQGLPMPCDIPWSLAAFFSAGPQTESGGPSPAAQGLSQFLTQPPNFAVSERFIPFDQFRRSSARLVPASATRFRWFCGHDEDTIPVCRNPRAKVRTERFHPHYVEMLRVFDSLPPGPHDPQIVLAEVSPAAWTSVNKLSYEPWALVEDGGDKGCKQITSRGKAFLRNHLKIPLHIANMGKGWESLGLEKISLRFFEDRKKLEQKLKEEAARQLELFP